MFFHAFWILILQVLLCAIFKFFPISFIQKFIKGKNGSAFPAVGVVQP